MSEHRIVIIGAGIAGLVAALDLARHGLDVTVVERAATPGGKMRELVIDGRRIDAGPTVFTLRRVLDQLLAEAGTSLAEHLTLRPAEILARHAWDGSGHLDLFADRARSAEAIGAFAGAAESRRFLRFCDHARRVYETLEKPFILARRPSLEGLIAGAGLRGLGGLMRIRPFTTMWSELGGFFHDPRLRQLFGRYATYCGSSPFLAPATLMLVAHVEQEGVWLIDGGMHRLARVLAALAADRGARFLYRAEASEILVEGGRTSGVMLADGRQLPAYAVIANSDVAALAAGRLGARAAAAMPPQPGSSRSLSALTWALLGRTEGFPLVRHNVFFSPDYEAEFDDILVRGQLPARPTVYVCAQDRGDGGEPPGPDPERLFCLVNAPATGDRRPFEPMETTACEQRAFAQLERCGLRVERQAGQCLVTTPADFERLFPATGGALYGQASHGWRASFSRPGTTSRLPGLYLAGGSVHPGPGVPMAALSGRAAAASLLAGLASIRR